MNKFYIIARQYISHDMIFEALQLDKISYDDVYRLQIDTCISYFEKNRDIYIMALDEVTQKVIGYINFSPITDSTFNKLISGNVIDTIITDEDILPYIDNNQYKGYFSSIVVHPDYRRHGVATEMLKYWSTLLVELAKKRKIYFQEIVADAVSDVGVELLTKIGFTLVKNSTHGSKIMTLNLFSNTTRTTNYNSRILKVYRKCNK